MMSRRASPRPAIPGPRAEQIWLAVVVGIVFVVALVMPHEPDRIDVTMQNPTDYLLYISASTPDNGTRTPVAIVSPRTSVDVAGVIDRGDDWVLHVRSPGTDAGVVAVRRSDLVEGAYTIPAVIGEQLVAAGVISDIDLAHGRGR